MSWPKSADGFARPPPAFGFGAPSSIVNEVVASVRVAIFAKTSCPFCKEVIALFSAPPYSTVPYRIVQLDREPGGEAMQDYLLELTGARTVPRVFVDGVLIGGCDQTKAAHASGKLTRQLFGASENSASLRIWRTWPMWIAVVLLCLWRRGWRLRAAARFRPS